MKMLKDMKYKIQIKFKQLKIKPKLNAVHIQPFFYKKKLSK